ncbi:MAG: hypothetical protein ABH845_02020 [Candidatus Omnitrophota bacterium]
MRVFGYLRREPTLDAPHQAAWLEAQRLAIRRFCRKKRMELANFFESKDPWYFEDPTLEEMLTALERGEADCTVLCREYEGLTSFKIDHLEKMVELRFYTQRFRFPLLAEEAI